MRFTRSISAIISVILLIISVPVCRADVSFLYDAGSPILLGKNIDILTPSMTKTECISHKEPDLPTSVGTAADPIPVDEVRFTSRFVDNYEQLYSLLSINVEMKAEASIKSLVSIKADTGLSSKMEFTRNSGNQYLVVLATYDFGVREVSGVHLLDAYKTILNTNSSDFRSDCGTHYVAREQRWAFAALTIKINNLSESALNSIKAHIGGEASVKGVASASAIISLEKLTNEIRKYSSLDMDFVARGGDGSKAAALAKVVADQNVAGALSALADYMSSVRWATSVPRKFWLASLPDAPAVAEKPDRIEMIRRLYFLAVQLQADIDQAEAEIEHLAGSGLKSTNAYRLRSAQYSALNSRKAEVEEAISRCFSGQVCSMLGQITTTPLSANLLDWQVNVACGYGPYHLDRVEVLTDLSFVSTDTLLDLEFYRSSPDKERQQTFVTRTSFNADPERRRVAARIDTIDVSRLSDDMAIASELRGSQYEVRAVSKFGTDQWYILGQAPFVSQDCPHLR